jgi:hypothetical protein
MNKKVNIKPDSDVDLFTLGLNGELTSDKFEFGFEVAANSGRQHVYSVDKNKIELKTNETTGALEERYSHILDGSASAIATGDLKAELTKGLHRDGATFFVGTTSYNSADDRITNEYRNRYQGTMFVVDGSFLSNYGFKLSVAGGYASGGPNPHSDPVNKGHKGFVGISEVYSGKRVPSMIILGGGNVKRPLALGNKNGKLKDFIEGAFTDVIFVGSGLHVAPESMKERKTEFSVNSLLFVKDHQHNKINLIDDQPVFSETEKACRFLGVELNGLAKIEPIAGLTFGIKGAVFFPGTYYKDITGAQLSEDVIGKLKDRDLDKIYGSNPKSQYRIASDTCYYISLDVKYKF